MPLGRLDGLTPNEIESLLRAALRGRRLVYEVGFEESHRAPLVRARQTALTEAGRGGLASLYKRKPALLVTSLVTEAIFGYELGDLWPSVHLDAPSSAIGQAFESAISELKLEPFCIFDQQSAQRYVSRIVAHGGVPVYCLPDLFKLAQHARDHDDNADDIISLLSGSSSWRQRIDRPVLRFLRDTGDIGRDYFGRTLELFEEWEQGIDLDELAARAGLPGHVAGAFIQHLAAAPAIVSSRPSILPPRIVFDADTMDAPELVLPSQPTLVAAWRLIHEDATVEIDPIDVRVTVREARLPLVPARSWRAYALDSNSVPLRSFSLRGVSDDNPALVFDVESGERIADPRYSPAQEVWVLVPCSLTVEAGGLEVRGTVSAVGTGWLGWSAHDVIVSSSGIVRGQYRESVITVELGYQTRGELRFSNQVPSILTIDGQPVFDAAPRIVSVPWTSSDLDRWSLVVIHADGARTPVALSVTPEDVTRSLAATLGAFLQPDLILQLRGPVGASQRIRAAVVPGLRILLPQRPMFPGDDLLLAVSARDDLILADADGDTRSEWAVSAESPVVTFTVTDESDAKVECVIRVPSVRWRIVSDTTTASQFAGTTIAQVIADEGDAGRLVLQLDSAGEPGEILAELRNSTGVVASMVVPRVLRGSVSRIDLTSFAAALRIAPESSLDVVVQIGSRSVNVATLLQSVTLAIQSVSYALSDERAILSLALDQSKPISNRRALLVSLDRPWRPPVAVELPDGARQDVHVDIEILPAGRYRASVGLARYADAITVLGKSSAVPFEVLWTDAADGSSVLSLDPREALAELAARNQPPTLGPENLESAAPEAALLLGSSSTDEAAATRILSALSLPLEAWTTAIEEAGRKYGMTQSACVRCAIRAYVFSAPNSATHTWSGESTTRLLAALGMKGLLRRPAGAEASDQAIEVMVGVRPDSVLAVEDVLGAQAGRATEIGLRDELKSLGQIPNAPLSSRGRACGLIRLRLLAIARPTVVRAWSEAFRAREADMALMPASLRRACLRAKSRTRAAAESFAAGTSLLRLNLASLEAAAHVAARTERAREAGEFLAQLCIVVPDYVETRIAFCARETEAANSFDLVLPRAAQEESVDRGA